MKKYVEVAKSVLSQNLYIKKNEQILIVTDAELKSVATIF